MLRTEQLIWNMHLAFAAGFVQLSGLLSKACGFILKWFRKHTFATVKKLCNYCLNTSLLSDWLQGISLCCAGPEKALESPCGKAAVDQVTPQTYQHSGNQSGMGLSHTAMDVLLVHEWEQSWESNAEGLQAILDLHVHGHECVYVYGSLWVNLLRTSKDCLSGQPILLVHHCPNKKFVSQCPS